MKRHLKVDMTTLLSTLQEISTNSPFTWNYMETSTSQHTQTETYHTSHRQGFTHIKTLHWKHNKIFPSHLDLHKELPKNCFSTARHYQRPYSASKLVLHRYDLPTVHTTRELHHLTPNWKLHRADLYTTKTIRNPTTHPPPPPPKAQWSYITRSYIEMTSQQSTQQYTHPHPHHTRTHTFHPSLGAT